MPHAPTPPDNEQLHLLLEQLNKAMTQHERTLDRVALMNRRLREAEANRIAELAELSHELKKPLCILKQAMRKPDNAANSERIHQAAERAAHILDKILSYTQLRFVQPEAYQPVHLSSLVHDCARIYQPDFAKHRFTYEVSGNLTVLASEEALCALVENLLDNARNYTPTGGRVELQLTGAPSHALMTVGNTAHITKTQAAKLGARFCRGDNKEVAGSGLGLSIARQAAEQLGGSLALDVPKRQWFVVEVMLPLHAAE